MQSVCERINQNYSSVNNRPTFIYLLLAAVVLFFFFFYSLAFGWTCAACTKVKRASSEGSINKMLNTNLSLHLDSTATHVHNSSIDHIFPFTVAMYDMIHYSIFFLCSKRERQSIYVFPVNLRRQKSEKEYS